MILGGYPGDDYQKATALVVTYLLNDSLNKTYQEFAERWEEKFLELVGKQPLSDIGLEIAYSAQSTLLFNLMIP